MPKSPAEVARLFQLSGLIVKYDAAEFVAENLALIEKHSRSSDDFLADFVELLKRNPSATSLPLVDLRLCELVLNDHFKERNQRLANSALRDSADKATATTGDDEFVVVSAFECPRFKFDSERGRFSRMPMKPDPLPESAADAKTDLYVNRYWVLLDRLRRSQVFAAHSSNQSRGQMLTNDDDNDDDINDGGVNRQSSTAVKKNKRFVLTSVECLLGSAVDSDANGSSKNNNNNNNNNGSSEDRIVVVFGLLTRMKDGNWHIEDPTGFVRLDLSSANFQQGLLGEHCFVLVEGRYDDGDVVFRVRGIGLPPSEPAQVSRLQGPCGDVNMFGGGHSTSVTLNPSLAESARAKSDEMAIILSDVWLDVRAVLDKLRLLLAGYAEQPPFAFFICGNFLSTHYGERQSIVFREKFAEFYSLIASFRSILATSRFVFIPGADDPGLADTLPRFPLLKCLLPPGLVSCPTVSLASNPCRVTWFNREIVIFRADLVHRLSRHTVNCATITDSAPLSKHFVKTIASQAHLCPLPIYVQPVSWPYDHSLALNPLPDLVLIADRYSSYNEVQAGCRFANCGSFVLNNFHFFAYYPSTNELEDCQVVDLNAANNGD